MSKIPVVGLTLCLLVPPLGAMEVEDQIRSACRWIHSEAEFPTELLTKIAASNGDATNPVEGISSGCSIVLSCLLEARSKTESGADRQDSESASADPASLCWRVTDIERLAKEEIDRMLSQLESAGARPAAREGDENPAACSRFLRCLSRSGIGVAEDRSWREEFARICAMTDIADTLSREELQALIDDSESLLGVLEKLSAPEAKVYIFRTKMCRDLFVYSLQLLEDTAPAEVDEAPPD